MSLFSVNGLTVATAATIDHAIASVWNPHATKRIFLLEVAAFAVAAPAAGAGFELRRITTRGTPATGTITPDADNSHEDATAPQSGFLLDLGPFTAAQPTLASPPLAHGFMFAAVAASGIIMPLRRIVIPPLSGIALVNRAAVICPALEVGVVVEE